MKLRVNLLSSDLVPERTLLDFSLTSRIWLAVTVLMGLLIGYGQWQLSEQEQQQQSLKQTHQQLQEQQALLVKAKAARKVSTKLKAEVDDAKQELEIKQELVKQVQVGERPDESPFSTLLVDLARVQERRIWLDSISISPQGVSMAGFASKTDVVPQWLAQVGSQGYLQGKTFDQILITQAQPWHRFELNTSSMEEQP